MYVGKFNYNVVQMYNAHYKVYPQYLIIKSLLKDKTSSIFIKRLV